MLVVALCEHFGWTYEEYQNTPAFFIELCIKKLEIDAKKKKQEEQQNRVRGGAKVPRKHS